MRVLFICNQNRHRSLTAEKLFKGEFETASAGLFNEHPVNEAQLEWADIIVVMEEFQRSELAKRFPGSYLKKRIVSLDIPDQFSYDQPELKDLLRERLTEALSIRPTAF
ncbi:phosphotyrosine protein phosphatase [archaeon]|nr:phosphotyrosine protein phosphatase [archaeon]